MPDPTGVPGAHQCVVRAAPDEGPFRHPLNPASEVYGRLLARKVGLTRLGVNRARLAAGKESFVLHRHHAEEEWLYVLSGRGALQIGDATFEVGPGDFAGFPPGTFPHHLRNPGPDDLAYVCGGESRDVEVGDFPELGRRLVRLPSEATVYPLDAGAPLVAVPPAAAPAGLAPAHLLLRATRGATRDQVFRHKLNPRSELAGHGLSDRVGLSRVAVNLARLAPGKESYVYHRHAIEEEWLYVLAGRAVADIGDERVELGPGDFGGFPPGAAAHLVTNPFAEPVSYLEGGEVLPVDVVDFPRLGKRMVRTASERTLYDESAGAAFSHAPLAPGGG